MEQNKQHFNIWKYLPTWKEAKWWVLIGIAHHSLTMLLLVDERIRNVIIGGLPRWLEYIAPFSWVQYLLFSVFGPTYPPAGEMFAYGAFLGGLAGYLLRTIFKLVIRR